MDFKFTAVDSRRQLSSSSSSSSFNNMRAQAFWPHPHFNRPGPVQWEMEKAQIREEIIASEIARRRALEAEVIRELTLERQMAAMHTAIESGLSFEQRLTMQLDSRRPFMHHNNNDRRWLPQESFPFLSPPPLPPPMWSPPPMLAPGVTEFVDAEVKATPEGNKDKLIVLAKPNPTSIVGAKRKTPPLAGAGELSLPLFNLKNKPKDEWSCAICRVSATSEKGLTEHLQGRKHKARQARLRAEAMEKNSNPDTISLPKKPIKLAKVEEILVTTDLGSEDNGKLKSNEDELVVQTKKKIENFSKKVENHSLGKTHGSAVVDKVEGTLELTKKKKFRFWCQLCKVGANSKVVMGAHNKGRKHVAQLKKLEENNAADLATTTYTVTEHTSLEGTQMLNDFDLVTKEANEKPTDVQKTDSCNPSPGVN